VSIKVGDYARVTNVSHPWYDATGKVLAIIRDLARITFTGKTYQGQTGITDDRFLIALKDLELAFLPQPNPITTITPKLIVARNLQETNTSIGLLGGLFAIDNAATRDLNHTNFTLILLRC
jgi:hypothetical protein